MTTQPSDPTDADVDAVALLLARANGTEWDLGAGDDCVYRRDARAVLTTTDPAALDAMLGALTRAGVLDEEHDRQQAWNRAPQFHAVRLVTVWRDVSHEGGEQG